MAINAKALVDTVGSWLTNAPSRESVADTQPLQAKSTSNLSLGWGALDEEECQRVQKVATDLIKYQSVYRGY